MKRIVLLSVLALSLSFSSIIAQDKNPIIEKIVKEANETAQLEKLVESQAFHIAIAVRSNLNYCI
jgi:hypothetical protein